MRILEKITTTMNLINKEKEKIQKTLVIEKKEIKTIHTFNVKANRKGVYPLKLPLNKNQENKLKESIFHNRKNSIKRDSIFNSSKVSPVLTFNTSKLMSEDSEIKGKLTRREP